MKKQNFEIVKGTCGNATTFEVVEGELLEVKEIPNIQFFIRKINNGYWNISEVKSGLEVFTDKTKKAVIQKLINYELEHPSIIKQCVDNARSIDEQKARLKKINELEDEFTRIFNFEMPKCYFTGGIDIIKLDEKLGTNRLDGISMNDYIINKYGQRASEIVDALISV